MEFSKPMLVLLMILAGLAFLFQLIGFFGPGWLVYELEYNVNFQYFSGHGNQYGGTGYGGNTGGSYGGGGYNTGGSYGGNYPNNNNQYGGNYPNSGNQYGGSYGGSYGGGGYGGNQPNFGGSWSNLGGSSMIVRMKYGLWASHGCIRYTPDREDCQQVTNNKIESAIGLTPATGTGTANTRSESDGLFKQMSAQKVLATLALILAIIGLIFNILLFTTIIESSKCKRVMCAVFWIISAIFVFAAIGVMGKDIADINEYFYEIDRIYRGKYKFESLVPWSLVISGFGAFFALVNAVLTLFMLPRCIGDSDKGSYSVDKPERGGYSEAPMKAMNEYT